MRLLALMAAATLAACASVSEPPPPPPSANMTVLPDWRAVVTVSDRDRLSRLEAAWRLSLQQARRQSGSGDLSALGNLTDADLARPAVAPQPGVYRCRTVKLGSQGGEAGLGFVIYGWFQCRVEATPRGLRFVKTSGSQRPAGLLYPENDRRMVFLGSQALAAERSAAAYGQRPDRDIVGALERIGERRWRLALPWPQTESNLDLIELVPA